MKNIMEIVMISEGNLGNRICRKGVKMTEEKWVDIKGFEGLYQVSNMGNVKSIKKNERIMKLQVNHKGYYCVNLHKNSIAYPRLVHRLVAEAFIPNTLNLPQVNHKDTNKKNNNIENLEWISNADNMRHAFANGCFVTTEKQREHARNNLKLIAERKKKGVEMYTKEGVFLNAFNSLREAEKCTGVHNSKISMVCKGKRKRAGNYIWKYRKE